MKNKNTLLLIAVGCLVAIGVVLVQTAQVSAQGPSLKEFFNFGQASAVVQDEERLQNPPFPDQAGGPVAVLVGPEVKSQNEKVVSALQKHLAAAETEYLTAGWLHIATQTEAFITASETLPNGDPVPTKWRSDTWFLLDSQGYVLQSVGFQDTGSPTTSQVVVFKDGVTKNLTFGFSTLREEKYKLELSSFLTSALRYRDTLRLEMGEALLDGKPVLEVSKTEMLGEPVYVGNPPDHGPGELIGSTSTVYFSVEEGLPLKHEQYYIYSDGRIELVQLITYIIIEKIDAPPAEVLEYLAQ